MTQSIKFITQELTTVILSDDARSITQRSLWTHTDFSAQRNRHIHPLAHSHIRSDCVYGLCPKSFSFYGRCTAFDPLKYSGKMFST